MCIDKKTSIVTDAMDLLVGFNEILTTIEKRQILQCVIDTLGSYPKPQKRTSTVRCSTESLGAYLCISVVRNACKLAKLEIYPYAFGLKLALLNLENALTLLSE